MWPWGNCVARRSVEYPQLQVHDRVVHSDGVWDLHLAAEHLVLPVTIVFFRPSKTASLSGTSLLWDLPGIHTWGVRNCTLASVRGDPLHTCALGQFAKYCGVVLHRALKADYFRVDGTPVQKLDLGILRLNKALNAYYKVVKMSKRD